MAIINDFMGRSTLTGTVLLPGGKVKTVEGIENVGQQITRALLVRRGGSLAARENGSELYKLQFMPADGVTFALMRSMIQDTVAEQVPAAGRLNISFERFPSNPGAVKVIVGYEAKKTGQNGTVDFGFQFAG